MPPSKTKKNTEESPEERRSKRRRINEDDEEEEKERDPISKGPPSKKAQLQSGGSSHKPAELFRKDLISAMKLADSEPLNSEDYILISDAWRQEWERGVQVPVNEISIPSVVITKVEDKNRLPGDFKIPKKYLHSTKDETYQLGMHELTGLAQLAEQVVRYDLDDLDVCWLRELNEEREVVGLSCILEWTMERVIESLETQCHENMELKKKTEEGLGIEYDMDIVCEICQSPNSEDTNEMVFCDGCDICVHQACYGITTVPEGSWLCRTCALGIKPQCILCPKVGGAMKSTRSGTKWSHVSCAIWIPEVNIGCAEKMEPITKISQIPASRWALICCICKERCGACIQCSVKSCKTAFHVTCAFSEKLEMKTILVEDKHSEDVKMKGYCPKHSRKRDRNSSESDTDSPRKSNPGSPVKEMTEEEKASMRADRLKLLEDEFYTLVQVAEIAKELQLEEEVVDKVFDYWKLKRKALMFNRPLLTPKTEEADLLEKQQEDSLVARMKMFVHLRQDLERVRNLSYMISKREKMKKQFSLSRESVFYAALEVLTDKHLNISKREVEKIVKQYKDVPGPYCNFRKKAKLFPSQSTVKKEKDTTSVTEGEDTLQFEGDTANNLLSPGDTSVEDDNVSKSLNSKTKSESETSKTDKKAAKSEPKTAKSEPKGVKSEPKAKKALLQTPISKKPEGKAVTDSDDRASVGDMDKDLNNSAMDTSVLVDVESTDDTLVNTSVLSQDCSADTLTPSESEHVVNKDTPNTQASKRGRKKKSLTAKPEIEKSVKEVIKTIKKEETNSDVKPVKRSRGRPRKIVQTGGDDVKTESETKSIDSVMLDNKSSFETEASTSIRERRQSAPFKISDEEKAKLVHTYPSAKNVSDQVKAELNGFFKNNKLVVSNKIKQKVQNSLLNSKRRSRFSNGIIIDHSQKKIENYFVKSPPTCDPNAQKSPTKSVSRVLNELSPTRDRFEANNIERTRRFSGKQSPRNSPIVLSRDSSPDRRSTRSNCSSPSISSVKEKLFDNSPKPSRKGRASSPDSVKSYSSLKLEKVENDKGRIRTRSLTPSGKDLFESDFMDTENTFDAKRRRLRNSQLDGREGSRSPQLLLKSQVSS